MVTERDKSCPDATLQRGIEVSWRAFGRKMNLYVTGRHDLN
jgi:hypothetical protein